LCSQASGSKRFSEAAILARATERRLGRRIIQGATMVFIHGPQTRGRSEGQCSDAVSTPAQQATGPEAAGPAPRMLRLFVVGCQRSGTTLIQAALARHPRLFTLPETHYFLHLLGGIEQWVAGDVEGFRRKVRSRLALARARTHRELKRDLASILDHPSKPRRLPLYWRGASYIGAFRRLLDEAAADAGAVGWLEKSPDHLAYIDIIEQHIPDARFLHVLRRGEDVIASVVDAELRYAEQGVFRGGLVYWIERWNRAVETQLRYAGRDNHVFITLENYLREPQAAAQRAQRLLGLPAAPDGDSANRQASIADAAAEPWKASALRAPLAETERKFEALFGPALQQRLRDSLLSYESVTEGLASLHNWV
jgi:hypothetical protein